MSKNIPSFIKDFFQVFESLWHYKNVSFLSTLFLADDSEKATVLLEATKYCFLYHKSQ